MVQTRQRRDDSFSRQQEALTYGGSHSPAYLPTHGVPIASVHAGDSGEFKPEYMSPALAGPLWGKGAVVYGSLGF
jgi:hypothetical protein